MSAGVTEPALSAELDKLGPAPSEPGQDSTPTDTPKRRSRSGTSGAARARAAKAAGTTPSKPRAPRRTAPQIGDGMARLYTMMGLALSVVPSGPAVAGPSAGQATITGAVGLELVTQSQALGAAWEQAAKEDPRIREALEKLLAVSTLGTIIAAHVPVIMAGLIAADLMPAALGAQVGSETTAP